MTTQTLVQTQTTSRSATSFAPMALAILVGVFMLTVSGFAQATVLHDAAHDQRHAMAFPCH